MIFMLFALVQTSKASKTDTVKIQTQTYCDHCKECESCWGKMEKELMFTKGDRKSTRLNSSHGYISYAVFCLKKKKIKNKAIIIDQQRTTISPYIKSFPVIAAKILQR